MKVVVSGYFDPVHKGHIEQFKLAKELAGEEGKLILILNNDEQAILKNQKVFMPLEDRKKILESIKYIDEVFISIDKDRSVCKSLEFIKPNIFAKGGDRFSYEIPESEICRRLDIKIIDGLGQKVQSSSELLKNFLGENKTEFGRRITNCRMCESANLYEFLDLGFIPPADRILSKGDLKKPEIFFPLKVAQCLDCGLTQLTYAANPEILYGERYLYESSITKTGREHFWGMADSICKKFNLNPNSLVVDIGSNVGVLLDGFKKNGMNVLGIDPAPKIAKIANENGIETWQEFINSKIAEDIVSKKGKAKIITGTNVFAHIDNKKELMESIKIMLDEEGVFIIEVPYLIDLIEKMEYDTIYMDHLEYISVKPLVKFFKKFGMDVFDVEKYDIHGTSIRVFVCREGKRKIEENVKKFLDLEEKKGVYKKEILDNFANKIKNHKKEFIELLIELKKQGKKVIGISSPAKGNTLLNYCKIDNNLIDYITEKSLIKIGNYTPGMHIPIVNENKILEDKPDYGIIFAWNFANEIIKNNKEYSKLGGKFIIPITEQGIEIRNYININNK